MFPLIIAFRGQQSIVLFHFRLCQKKLWASPEGQCSVVAVSLAIAGLLDMAQRVDFGHTLQQSPKRPLWRGNNTSEVIQVVPGNQPENPEAARINRNRRVPLQHRPERLDLPRGFQVQTTWHGLDTK